MSKPVISVENLSKAYRIGVKDEIPDTLVGALSSIAKSPFKNFNRLRRLDTFNDHKNGETDSDDTLWALKDVSFDVQEGEVVGIIGRNGAGKSTLLKVLSRITEPTSGRVTIRGRVSSLLEVGTGFHPELTGRENIYMNGTILGMTKREIDRKFDEIVDFSGVERFLDTPVKRYSSGMQVRLAFAVAAHLEPEILIIDEVLAVGDVEFQKKCLGKMQDVAEVGRTVLFVSHNMAAIRELCSRGILLKNGIVHGDASVDTVLNNYFDSSIDADLVDQMGNVILKCQIHTDAQMNVNQIPMGAPITFELHMEMPMHPLIPSIGIGIQNHFGQRITTVATYLSHDKLPSVSGSRVFRCHVDSLPLIPGRYSLRIAVGDSTKDLEVIDVACPFQVVHSQHYGRKVPGARQGVFSLRSTWELSEQPARNLRD